MECDEHKNTQWKKNSQQLSMGTIFLRFFFVYVTYVVVILCGCQSGLSCGRDCICHVASCIVSESILLQVSFGKRQNGQPELIVCMLKLYGRIYRTCIMHSWNHTKWWGIDRFGRLSKWLWIQPGSETVFNKHLNV